MTTNRNQLLLVVDQDKNLVGTVFYLPVERNASIAKLQSDIKEGQASKFEDDPGLLPEELKILRCKTKLSEVALSRINNVAAMQEHVRSIDFDSEEEVEVLAEWKSLQDLGVEKGETLLVFIQRKRMHASPSHHPFQLTIYQGIQTSARGKATTFSSV